MDLGRNQNAGQRGMADARAGQWSLHSLSLPTLLIFALIAASAWGGPSTNTVKQLAVKKVVMPVYLDLGAPAVAVLRAEKIYPTHKRWGYFRIGLLPLLECDGVTIEVSDAEKTAQALAGVRDNLKVQAGGTIVELREVAIRFPPEITPRLKAGTIGFDAQGQWSLTDVALQSGTNVLHLPRAQLQVSGPQAGQVTWESAGIPASANLFAVRSTANNVAVTQRNP